ncbi:hypothetical protein F5Y04DRAFT_82180 [Hypomontagnella monticulosa]|nr:hypothetical protein F5Y04DRAFT_82180 [Hypomontagnella monticulosa]
MEALAAVGLASNIFQLIDCGYKVVKMARELQASGREAIESNANASFVAQEMLELSQRVMKDLPRSGLSDDERALCELAEKCSQLSTKLLLLLRQLEVKSKGRRFEILITVFRNMRRRSERDQLQASLDNYRNQLNIQINNMSRSDLAQRLELTLNTASMSQQDIRCLRDDVLKLRQKSMVDSANLATFFQNLQEIVEIPLRQSIILQGLQYPRMYDRYENVDMAHHGTFKWLLHGPEKHQDGEQEGSVEIGDRSRNSSLTRTTAHAQAKDQKHREFVTWLQGGSDPLTSVATGDEIGSTVARKGSIFHIAGKPGAGKSTLMKFICENEETSEHLKKWSGGKPVICAKAFLWKFGDDDQKNLTGLRTCLLHQILKSAPRLIPVAFPSAWGSDYTGLTSFDPHGTKAFDTLLGSGRAFEYKMIFFIDGLDEFMGQPIDLVREIISWATRNPTDLKICVSSREWNEFEVGFQGYPSLRIQEWTRDDIGVFVADRFDEICELSTLINKTDLNPLAEMIVDKAEGVFLWVRVALAALEQGVLNGDELQDIRGKVLSFPSELKDLYQHLFDSIPEYDRRKAFEAMIFASWQSFRALTGTLLQYKYLNDLARDPDFAIGMSAQPLADEELKGILANTSRQINGRCKGFLEICPTKKEKYPGDEDVKPMHATVNEFLTQKNVRNTIKSYFGDEDLFDRFCYSFVALSKSIDTEDFYIIRPTPGDNHGIRTLDSSSLFIRQLNSIMSEMVYKGYRRIVIEHIPASKDRFLGFLSSVEQIATQRLPSIFFINNNLAYWMETREVGATATASWVYLMKIPNTQLVMVLAAQRLLVEYFEKGGRCDLRDPSVDPAQMTRITSAALSGVTRRILSPRAYRMLELLFEAGISPNVNLPMDDRQGGRINRGNLWGWVLRRLLYLGLPWNKHNSSDEKELPYKLIELCLRYGAEENLTLTFGPCYEVVGADRLLVQVTMGDSDGRRTNIDGEMFHDLYVDYHLDIVQYAAGKGGLLTFRDLLAHCFPHNYHYLYALLDKKCPITSHTNEDATESGNTRSVEMPIIFPFENRYREEGGFNRFSVDRKPAHCKQSSMNLKECFENEAKLKEKRPGSCEP